MAIAVGDHYLNPTPDAIKRVSCAFGGGVGGCRQELCGVLGGGVIILGALYGRVDVTVEDQQLKDLVCAFRDQFTAHFGTSQCEPIRDALPDEPKRCGGVVLDGVEMLLDIMKADGTGA